MAAITRDRANNPSFTPMQFICHVDGNGDAIDSAKVNGAIFGTSLGYEQLSAAALAAATHLDVPAGAKYAVIQAEGGDMRWRDDGPPPTGTLGTRSYDSVVWVYQGDLTKIQFIQVTGMAAGVVNVTFY